MQKDFTIQAGAGAFGDGAHPTTRMLLKALAAMQGEAPKNALDVGCGSGILSVSIAGQWHCPVLATDIEASSIATTQQNAEQNGLAGKITTIQTAHLSHPTITNQAPFDLIVMNILSNPLLALAHDAVQHLAPEGILMLSGLLAHEVAPIQEAYQTLGIYFLHQLSSKDWRALIGTKPQIT